MFLIDKNKRLQRRIEILSDFLGRRITEDMFMVPAVREHLSKYSKQGTIANTQPELFPDQQGNDQ